MSKFQVEVELLDGSRPTYVVALHNTETDRQMSLYFTPVRQIAEEFAGELREVLGR